MYVHICNKILNADWQYPMILWGSQNYASQEDYAVFIPNYTDILKGLYTQPNIWHTTRFLIQSNVSVMGFYIEPYKSIVHTMGFLLSSYTYHESSYTIIPKGDTAWVLYKMFISKVSRYEVLNPTLARPCSAACSMHPVDHVIPVASSRISARYTYADVLLPGFFVFVNKFCCVSCSWAVVNHRPLESMYVQICRRRMTER